MAKMLAIVFSILLLSLTARPVQAAKRLLPRFRHRRSVPAAARSYRGVAVSPRLRGDRRALIIYFGNLQNATLVTYRLSYKTGGRSEGAGGSVNPSEGNRARREILFGTCSAGVCNYHTDISEMKLEIISNLTSGKKSIKRYLVRV
jgi:hypothetical protein